MNVITTKEQLKELVTFYDKVDAYAFDVETVGDNRLQPVINDVLWISLATEGRVDVIPMGHPNGEFTEWEKPMLRSGQLRLDAGKEVRDTDYSKSQKMWIAHYGPPPAQLLPGEVFKALKPLFFSDKLKIGHNIKFDLKSVAKYYKGVVPSKPYFDTLMASFLIDNRNKNANDLASCVKRELGVDLVKGVGAKVEIHSFDDVARYSALDAQVTWDLYKAYKPRLEGSLSRVWELEMDVTAALCDMELAGATIDIEAMKTLQERLEIDIDLARGKAYKAAGRVFPMNSNAEKQKILFAPKEEGGRGLKPNPRIKNALTKNGQEFARNSNEPVRTEHYSVSAEALEFFREKDALVSAIMEYQDLNKMMTTYVTPYLGGEVTRVTSGKTRSFDKEGFIINGKVHTNYKSHGAETGRLSSSMPNTQNIPSSGVYGKMIRNLFIAPPGHKLVVADYSQIEPRVIAAFSRDPIMVENYRSGGDIYTTIGNTMGVDRKAGKVLVLSIAYGVGPDKIATQIGCSEKDARALLTRFEKQFQDIGKHKARVLRIAEQQRPIPFVETIFGRRRYLPDLRSKEMGVKNRASRQAYNAVIQGSAADIMKLAIVRAHSCFIDEPDANVILNVHDELVIVCTDALALEVAEAVRESMEGISIPEIDLPLIADVKIVQKWGEAK